MSESSVEAGGDSTPSQKGEKNSKNMCEVCKKTFHNRSNLCKHRRLHLLPRKFPCDFNGCHQVFRKINDLEKHKRNFHVSAGAFKCDMCPKTFRSLRSLEQHVVGDHVVDKEFGCSVCDKAFLTEKDLERHMSAAHDRDRTPRHCCDLCPAAYTRLHVLLTHLQRIHSHSKRCDLCHTSFVNQEELDLHLESELDSDSNYYCSECSVAFKSVCLFKQHHISTHMEKKQRIIQRLDNTREEYGEFKCLLCQSSFHRKAYLFSHENSVHANAEWPCRICSKLFPRKWKLNRHTESAHGDKRDFTCTICSKVFHCVKSYRDHVRLHNPDKLHKCDKCPKMFLTQRLLGIHKTNSHGEGERPFKCPKCPAAFTSQYYLQNSHLPSHSVDRPFACDGCSQRFKTRNTLTQHRRKACSKS